MAIGQPSSHNVFLQIVSEKTFMKIKIQSEVGVTTYTYIDFCMVKTPLAILLFGVQSKKWDKCTG